MKGIGDYIMLGKLMNNQNSNLNVIDVEFDDNNLDQYFEKKRLKMPYYVEECASILRELEEKQECILTTTYFGDMSHKYYNINYLELINRINSFIGDCKFLARGLSFLKLNSELEKIKFLIESAEYYKENFPKTRNAAYKYVDDKIKSEELKTFCNIFGENINTLSNHFNSIIDSVANSKMDKNKYHRELNRLHRQIRNNETLLFSKKDLARSLKMEFESFKLDEFISQLNQIRECLNTTYYNASLSRHLKLINRKLIELESSLSLDNNKLNDFNLGSVEGLALIDLIIEKRADIGSLKYFRDNFDRIRTEVDKKIVLAEAEVLADDIKHKEISKELVRLYSLKNIGSLQSFERVRIFKLANIQKTIEEEKRKKKIDLALLLGEKEENDYLESVGDTNFHFYRKLYQKTGEVLKLEKQLEELKRIEETRSKIYLELKFKLIERSEEFASFCYINDNINDVKNLQDQKSLEINKTIAGLSYKKKVLDSEIFRLYGLKANTKLTIEENAQLTKCIHIKEETENKLLNKQLEKARFLGKCEEYSFINSNLSYNELDREYLLKFAKLLNIDKQTEVLEEFKLGFNKVYLNLKKEEFLLQYEFGKIRYLHDEIDTIDAKDMDLVNDCSDIEGRRLRMSSIAKELKRIKTTKKKTSELDAYISEITRTYENDKKIVNLYSRKATSDSKKVRLDTFDSIGVPKAKVKYC